MSYLKWTSMVVFLALAGLLATADHAQAQVVYYPQPYVSYYYPAPAPVYTTYYAAPAPVYTSYYAAPAVTTTYYSPGYYVRRPIFPRRVYVPAAPVTTYSSYYYPPVIYP